MNAKSGLRGAGCLLAVAAAACGPGSGTLILESEKQWRDATGAMAGAVIGPNGLELEAGGEGHWTGAWREGPGEAGTVRVTVRSSLELFRDKTIEVVVDGSEEPYTGSDGVPHDWYGRSMIAILDQNRWVMALRSGLNHIDWKGQDAIHILTSSDEGRTWGELDRWFDGSPISGMPFDDGYTHSEPGLYRMPSGDLILQFWRTAYSTGTRQLRSHDGGKTWVSDHDRIHVQGVTGAPGDLAIGTEDWFVDPENPTHVYMAFQYFHHEAQAGTLLARSTDDGQSYEFLSWIGPLASEKDPDGGATFEPAIEYVGNRTIVAVLRDAAGNRHTWQTVSTDMGATFAPLEEISPKVDGGVEGGLWQRARIYKESNPRFQHGNVLDYAAGEGRLWGMGLHSIGGGYTRKPVVYWSDDDGATWQGPELLHGPMLPGTDTGYGDLKRRVDGAFVAVAYYATRDFKVSDLEQYTFGGRRARFRLEEDADGDGEADGGSSWRELHGGVENYTVPMTGARWRLNLRLSRTGEGPGPGIESIRIEPSQE